MKSNKILILIICILSVLVLVLGGLLIFRDSGKDKKETNNEVVEENVEVKNEFTSVVRKEQDKLYGLKAEGEAVELLDVSEYNGGVAYTYHDNKLYLFVQKYTPGQHGENGEVLVEFKAYNTLGYVDLTAKEYKFVELSSVNIEGSPESIAVFDGVIYLTSSSFDGIYEYNMKTKEVSNPSSFGFDGKVGIRVYDVSEDKLAYWIAGTAGESPIVGVLDIETGTKKDISTNASLEYVYDGKVIYTQYEAIENYSKWTYYEYDVKTDTAKPISESASSSKSLYDSLILPVDDYYVYVSENAVYKNKDSKNEKLYEFDGPVVNIEFVSKNTLDVSYGGGFESEMKYGTLDLSTLTFTEKDNAVEYTQVLYLK